LREDAATQHGPGDRRYLPGVRCSGVGQRTRTRTQAAIRRIAGPAAQDVKPADPCDRGQGERPHQQRSRRRAERSIAEGCRLGKGRAHRAHGQKVSRRTAREGLDLKASLAGAAENHWSGVQVAADFQGWMQEMYFCLQSGCSETSPRSLVERQCT